MTETDPGSKATNSGRFQKGRSGNPGGRPRKRSVEPTSSAFDIVVNKTLTVTRDGVPREVTMEEALQHRTYRDAIAGKRMAQREVLKWIEKREAWRQKHTPPRRPIKPVQDLSMNDPDNADEALLILGIASLDPERADYGMRRLQLLLEPWAVQAALTRGRRRLKLDRKDQEDVYRCRRDPEFLPWPGGE